MIVFVNFIKHIFAVVPPGFFIANKLKHGRKKLKENAHPFEGANMPRSTFYTLKGIVMKIKMKVRIKMYI